MNLLSILIFHLSSPRFRIIKTLYVNFKLLPFKVAIKLPIYIYGKCTLYWVEGKAEIVSDHIYSGMIKLGKNSEYFNGQDNSAFLYLSKQSKIIFNGPCSIGNNFKIRVATDAILEFGEYTFFGSSIKIVCSNKIRIGRFTRIAFESQIIDDSFHYVYNESTGSVTNRFGSIILGEYNWVGNRVSISKNTQTKAFTIICANSYLSKDYTKTENEKLMLGGIPAKEIGAGYRRIFSVEIEKEISNIFSREKSRNTILYKKTFEDEYDSIINWFHDVM